METFVYSIGNEQCAPIAVCSVKRDGPHGLPLISNWMQASDEAGKALLLKVEADLLRKGFSRAFSVSHLDNITGREWFRAQGYGETILMDRKVLMDRKL